MDRVTVSLFLVALLVGVFNALIGPTGGVLAGSTSALVPPPASLLLHAAVSLASAVMRTLTLWRLVPWRLVRSFALVSLPSLLLALLAGAHVSSSLWRLAIAAFLASWALSSRFRTLLSRPASRFVAAVLAGAASSLVGAGGVLVFPAILSSSSSLDEAIATEAALTVVQNSVKVVALLFWLHVSLADHWAHLVLMALGSAIGLFLGRRLTLRLSAATRARLLTTALLAVSFSLVLASVL